MAAQSVVSRLAGYAYPTTRVTGTLTLLGMDAAQLLSRGHPAGERPRLRGQAEGPGRAVGAFAAGAGLGGLAVHRLGFWAITAPLAAVIACALKESASPQPGTKASYTLPHTRNDALPAPSGSQ